MRLQLDGKLGVPPSPLLLIVLLDDNSILILRQGYDLSIKELDGLLTLLSEKKRKMEREEVETNIQVMLDFLRCLQSQKLEQLNEVLSWCFVIYVMFTLLNILIVV